MVYMMSGLIGAIIVFVCIVSGQADDEKKQHSIPSAYYTRPPDGK